jgi:P27 family predicted phage terminase small subunit
MGLRGPAPTPRRLLELRGSPRATRDLPQPSPHAKRPPVPKWLKGEAKKIYLTVSGRLHLLGILAITDQNALARYAKRYALWLNLEAFIDEHGTTYVARAKPRVGEEEGAPVGLKTYPQARLSFALDEQLLRLEREFGMSPASRVRLSAGSPFLEDDGCSADFSGG